MAKIGFIGLGNMGGPMLANLVKAGHEVTAFDLDSLALKRAVDAGAKAASAAGDTAAGAEVVVTMLPAGRHVRSVYTDPEGVIEQADLGTLFIDCSTIDVATAREVADAASEAGQEMVDAPVSGGVAAAAGAALTFMVGGSDIAFARAEPILQAMGKAVIHAGANGAGQAAKICNNMLLGISMIGVCEAFNLADALGLDRQKLFDISSKASGQCWSLTSYCPVPGPLPTSRANHGYTPGFAAKMMLKDLVLSQEAAATGGANTPLGALARQIYQEMCDSPLGELDFSGVIKYLRGEAE
ncbi:MAG: 3-hydroxyisobutyrate dehydrogenase [Rhodospirillaceae bacterium]|nr:3-hydroxyisobutyrate dehydrogenase [Rhodospirillaceae bacterium]